LNAHEALDDLKQISVQVTAAAIGGPGGALEAATMADATAGERLVRLGAELWEAAEQARRDLGRDELSQVEVATPDGSVFVLRDAERTIVATTTVDPIVGSCSTTCGRACARSRRARVSSRPRATPPRTGRWRVSMARRRLLTAVTLAVGSAAGSVILRKRRGRNSRRADLYFDDGSMLSLSEGSPEADRLLPLAFEALAVAGSGG